MTSAKLLLVLRDFVPEYHHAKFGGNWTAPVYILPKYPSLNRVKTNVNKFGISSQATSYQIQKLVRQRIMVKATWRWDHSWSAIFRAIIYGRAFKKKLRYILNRTERSLITTFICQNNSLQDCVAYCVYKIVWFCYWAYVQTINYKINMKQFSTALVLKVCMYCQKDIMTCSPMGELLKNLIP